MTIRPALPAALLAASALALAGCAAGEAPAADGRVHIVASTNVYGDIAAQVGGDAVEVTSIIGSLAQDPHSYEATARDRLAVADADLVLMNGGGYDDFVADLAEETDAEVLRAVDLLDGHDHDHEDHADDAHAEEDGTHGEEGHVHDGNEHIWYDPHTAAFVATALSEHLAEIDPDGAADYEARADAFLAELEILDEGVADIAAAHAGAGVFVTEPVPVPLLQTAGLVDVAPSAFTEAVEEGQDVPPATLLEARRVLASGEARAVIANAQTGGAETSDVIAFAREQDIPVLEFTELVPEGESYLSWMTGNIAALAEVLE